MGVVGGIFNEGGENYALFASWSEVVVVAGPAVSRILDVDGVEVKGVGGVRDETNRGTRRLILFVISNSISAAIVNLAILIFVFFNNGD